MQCKSDQKTQDAMVWRNAFWVLFKAILLFLFVLIIFQVVDPVAILSHVSVYNVLAPGRQRLPFNDYVEISQAYNISITRLEPMLRSHIVASPKPADEYRVILLGDSALWGYLLPPGETLDSQINSSHYTLPDGRKVKAYNLGYPFTAVEKDLLLLDAVLDYEPDMFIWLVTLDAVYTKSCDQLHPLIIVNIQRWNRLQEQYGLKLTDTDPCAELGERGFLWWRRPLADTVRLQILGIPWAMTGIDYYWPPKHLSTKNQNDFADDFKAEASTPAPFPMEALRFDVIEAGIQHARGIPALVVSEPIFIADGQNSDIHYNAYYPRWSFDLYCTYLRAYAEGKNWNYMDLWNALPKSHFSNTPLHLTANGEKILDEILGEEIIRLADGAFEAQE